MDQSGKRLQHGAEVQRLEVEKLKAEIAMLRSQAIIRPKSFARKASEWLFTGGAALGLLTVAAGYSGQLGGQASSEEIAKCDRALKIVTAPQLNSDLSEQQQDHLVDGSLQTLAQCDKEAGQ